ncbi:MAG TPA: hypothetical protein VF138_07030 [Caulobacteraceae bacterium]
MRKFFLIGAMGAALLSIGGSTHAAGGDTAVFLADRSGFPTINLTVAHSWSGVAPCLTGLRQDPGQMERRTLAAVRGARLESAQVRGFSFVDQPAPLIAAFRRMTRLSGRQALPGSDSGCSDVRCAARAVFGEEAGPRLLLLAAVFHYNASDLGELHTRAWSVEELDEVLAAFEDLPPSLFPLDRSEYRALAHRHHQEGRFPESTNLFELAAEAGEGEIGIMIDQGWHHASIAERRAIIVHELAHEFTRARGPALNWRERWQAAVDADAARDTRAPTVASAYAMRNLDEDFAESVTAYRYMAPLLMTRAPHRYALLKSMVFDGQEYGSAARCAAPQLARVAHVRR